MPSPRPPFRAVIFAAALTAAMALAQPSPDSSRRVAWISTIVVPAGRYQPDPAKLSYFRDFRERLGEHGFAQGRNLILRAFFPPVAGSSGYALATREAIAWKPNVIIVFSSEMARVAKAETSQIPIVFTWVDGDPADAGLVTSPGRPGGNLTGLSYHYDLFAQKRLELVRELLPRSRHVVTLVDKAVWKEESVLRKLKAASSHIGLQLDEIDVSLVGGMKRALEGLAARLPDAVVPMGLHSDPNYSKNLAEFQARTRVPVIDDSLESADGVVIALAEDDRDHFRRAADMAVKVLNGANPRELPVDTATRFFLVVNERAAKGIGINVPASILIRADRVIR